VQIIHNCTNYLQSYKVSTSPPEALQSSRKVADFYLGIEQDPKI